MLKMVGSLSLSPGARWRDPLAQPMPRSNDGGLDGKSPSFRDTPSGVDPESRSKSLEIPGSRGACHRAAQRADPLARPGMTISNLESMFRNRRLTPRSDRAARMALPPK